MKNGYASSRSGTPDYPVSERSNLFRLTVSEAMGKGIIEETLKIRKEIDNGSQKYTAWINDTCAETAYDILIKFITNLPSGTGAVKQDGMVTINVINPYMWHSNIRKSKLGQLEVIYPREASKFETSEPHKLLRFDCWILKPKDKDPLVSDKYVVKK